MLMFEHCKVQSAVCSVQGTVCMHIVLIYLLTYLLIILTASWSCELREQSLRRKEKERGRLH